MQDLLKIKWVNRINNYAIPVVLFRSSNPKGHVMYCHGFTLFLTKVVNLNSAHGKVYSIQHYMIKFVACDRSVALNTITITLHCISY